MLQEKKSERDISTSSNEINYLQRWPCDYQEWDHKPQLIGCDDQQLLIEVAR